MSHYKVSVLVPARIYEGHNFIEEGVEAAERLTRAYVDEAMAPYEESPEQGSEYLKEEDITDEVIDSYLEDTTLVCVSEDGSIVNTEDALIRRRATEEEQEIIVKNGFSVDALPNGDRFHHAESLNNNHFDVFMLRKGINKARKNVYEVTSFTDFAKEAYGISRFIKSGETIDDTCSYAEVKDKSIDKIWSPDDNVDDIRKFLTDRIYIGTFNNPDARWDYWRIVTYRDESTGKLSGIIPTKDGRMVPTCPISEMALEYPWTEEDEKQCRAFWEVASGQRPATPEEQKSGNFFIFYKPEYYDKFYGTYEKYRNSRKTFYTHAIVTEDEGWIEPGTVGWFATCDETPESKDAYVEKFRDIIKNANPNDVMVGLDCHI